jgi:hypothetical protein
LLMACLVNRETQYFKDLFCKFVWGTHVVQPIINYALSKNGVSVWLNM